MIRIFVSAGAGEVTVKSPWFESKACQNLEKGGVKFGFEMKGKVIEPPDTSRPYGLHLPGPFATYYCTEGSSQELDSAIRIITEVNPEYVVLHGPVVARSSTSDLLFSGSGAPDFLDIWERFIDLIFYLMVQEIWVCVENTQNVHYTLDSGQFRPYLALSIGTYLNDMYKLFQETGCGTVLDVEHLMLAIQESSEFFAPERPDYAAFEMEDFLKLLNPQVVHICGTTGGQFVQIHDNRRSAHQPIKSDDAVVRHLLAQIVANNPDVTIVLEVASPRDPGFEYLSEDSQQTSFEVICDMLLKILEGRNY